MVWRIVALLVVIIKDLSAQSDGFYSYLMSLGQREVTEQLIAKNAYFPSSNATVNPYLASTLQNVSFFSPERSLTCDDPLALHCDTDALFSFKESMSLGAQNMLSSWKGSNPCDGLWKGVKCAEVFPGSFRVVQLQLGKNYYTKNVEENRWYEAFNAQHVPYMNCRVNEEIGEKMKFLEALNLMGCHVHGLPQSLSKLSKLQVLDLAHNNLQGDSAEVIVLPSWLGKLQDMRVIDMHSTGIKGTLPKELSSWSRIEIVNFYYNHFSGSVPKEYSSWVQVSSNPRLHYFLVGSAEVSSDICVFPETKLAFSEAVVMGGTDVTQLPLCNSEQLVG